MPDRSRQRKLRRLVCIVEGHGEVKAMPCLCSRVRDHLKAERWFVDPEPIRLPRSNLVTGTGGAVSADGIKRAVALARARPADAVLVLCDADDDCPKDWGPAASAVIQNIIPGGAVMAMREYEAWLLASMLRSTNVGDRRIDTIRGAKEQLARIFPGYKPTLHQLRLTQKMNVSSVRALSDSFDKLVRTLGAIFGCRVPNRQLVA